MLHKQSTKGKKKLSMALSVAYYDQKTWKKNLEIISVFVFCFLLEKLHVQCVYCTRRRRWLIIYRKKYEKKVFLFVIFSWKIFKTWRTESVSKQKQEDDMSWKFVNTIWVSLFKHLKRYMATKFIWNSYIPYTVFVYHKKPHNYWQYLSILLCSKKTI